MSSVVRIEDFMRVVKRPTSKWRAMKTLFAITFIVALFHSWMRRKELPGSG